MSAETRRARQREWQKQNPEKTKQYRTEYLRRKYLADFIAEKGGKPDAQTAG